MKFPKYIPIGLNFKNGKAGSSSEFIYSNAGNGISEIIFAPKITGKSKVLIHDNHSEYEYLFSLIEKYRKEKKEIKVISRKLNILNKNKFSRRTLPIDFTNNTSAIYTEIIKKIIDKFVALMAIILLSPLLLTISLLIKLTSPGSVLFLQNRVGFKGRLFIMYKFRTMNEIQGEDEERKEMMLNFMKADHTDGFTKIVNSKRITSLGRFLRRTSLDELPQLLNVLKGEMSLVGPRPDLPYVNEKYIDWQKKRINVLPGCTGLWQVTGRSLCSFNDSMLLDLYYTYKISFWLDIKILIRTIPVMIFSKGGA